MIQALLWDNDGVLVDTEHLFFEATRDVLAGAGVTLDLATYQDRTLRRGASCFDLVAERGLDAGAVARMRADRDALYHERLQDGVALLDGVEETLARLHGRLPMAIVTSCQPGHFAAIHAGLGILRYFDFVLTSGDYERHKPHPEPYLRAAARLTVRPESCLVVEDTERGLASAIAAGMTCLIVPHELTRGGDFTGSHAVLSSVRAVPDVLEGLA